MKNVAGLRKERDGKLTFDKYVGMPMFLYYDHTVNQSTVYKNEWTHLIFVDDTYSIVILQQYNIFIIIIKSDVIHCKPSS